MNYFGEDGPEFMGNINEPSEQELDAKKTVFLRHFMIDNLEYSLRRMVKENALFCAKKVGYF